VEGKVSTERGPDAGFDRLMREALAPGAAGTAGACPDADTLAAYAGGGLTGMERDRIVPHLASCMRCQGVLAIMARDADEVVAAVPVVPAWRHWLTIPRLRWLAPVAVAALGVILYVAVNPGTNLAPAGGAAPAADSTLASRTVPPHAEQAFAPEPPPASRPRTPHTAPVDAAPIDAGMPVALSPESPATGLDKETKKADATVALAEAVRDAPPQKTLPAESTLPAPEVPVPAPAPPAVAMSGAAAPAARAAVVGGVRTTNEVARQEQGAASSGALMVAAKGRRQDGFDEGADALTRLWHTADLVVLVKVLPVDREVRDRLGASSDVVEVFKRSPAVTPLTRLDVALTGAQAGHEYVLFLKQTPESAGRVSMTLVGEPLPVESSPAPGASGTSLPAGPALLARLRQLAGTVAR
jgi:hypothetical protein